MPEDNNEEKLTSEELEKKLNEMTASLEERAKILEQKEKELEEREKAVDEAVPVEKIEEKENEVAELQTKIKQMEEDFAEKLVEMERKPLLSKIKEQEDELHWNIYSKYISKACPKELKGIVKELEKLPKGEPAPPIVTLTVEEEKDELDKKFKEFEKSLNGVPEEDREDIIKDFKKRMGMSE